MTTRQSKQAHIKVSLSNKIKLRTAMQIRNRGGLITQSMIDRWNRQAEEKAAQKELRRMK